MNKNVLTHTGGGGAAQQVNLPQTGARKPVYGWHSVPSPWRKYYCP